MKDEKGIIRRGGVSPLGIGEFQLTEQPPTIRLG